MKKCKKQDKLYFKFNEKFNGEKMKYLFERTENPINGKYQAKLYLKKEKTCSINSNFLEELKKHLEQLFELNLS